MPEKIIVDHKLDSGLMGKLETELGHFKSAQDFLKSEFTQSNEQLRSALEEGAVVVAERIRAIVQSETFMTVVMGEVIDRESLSDEVLQHLAAAKQLLSSIGVKRADEIQVPEAGTLHDGLRFGGVIGAALEAVGIMSTNDIARATSVRTLDTPFTATEAASHEEASRETEIDDEALESVPVLLKISKNAVRINDGQIIKFAQKSGPYQEYGRARRRALERLVMLEEGEELSYNELADYLHEYPEIDEEAIASPNFYNVRNWLTAISVDDNPLIVHNGKRGVASRYSLNPLFSITIVSEYTYSNLANIIELQEETSTEPQELDVLIPRGSAFVIHGALAYLHRTGKLHDDFPEYPEDDIDAVVLSEQIEFSTGRGELLSEDELRARRQTAFAQLSKLMESDDLLRVIDIIEENDSRYLLVNFLSQLTRQQQEHLKALFAAQLVINTTHQKTQPYAGRFDPAIYEVSAYGATGDLLTEQVIGLGGTQITTAPNTDFLPRMRRAADDEAADKLRAQKSSGALVEMPNKEFNTQESQQENTPTELKDEATVVLNQTEDEHMERTLEVKDGRSKSQQRFFEAGKAYLDTQVIAKIIEHRVPEHMSRQALESYFSFMKVRKFVSAKENGLIKGDTEEDGLTYEDIFILALYGNRQLQGKMQVKSFKEVLNDLRTYFYTELNLATEASADNR